MNRKIRNGSLMFSFYYQNEQDIFLGLLKSSYTNCIKAGSFVFHKTLFCKGKELRK